MASGLEIIFPVRSVFEMESANKAIQDMQSALSGKASNLKLDFGSIMPGESMAQKLGGYQEFFESVRRASTDVGKLSTDFTIMQNAAGKSVAVATKEMYTLKGATGETSTTYKDFTENANQQIESLKKLGYQLVATTKEEANVARAQKMGNDAIRDAEKATNAASTAAEKYIEKSKNMGGQQVKTAQDAARAVLEQTKSIEKLDKSSQEYADGFAKLTQLTRNFNVAVEGTKVGANAFQGWVTRIGNAIQQTIAYSLSLGLVYKAQQMLNNAVRYAIDLNTEMTKIQVLQAQGAQTPEEINALAQSFNSLGKEMGASTLEIAKGSVEWFRQGRTVAETQELMRSSLMLSKLGAMESADATNYLTSITNAFRISSEDAVSVVDKLIAVDNIAATSAGELATAMRYTSESAAIAGVSMEQLVSYIGTVSTVTRQNAEMIGQAFKTMFARMTQIQGGGVDETGVTISKVEAALAKVNVEVRNADGSFRNMGDVLEETAAQWATLTDREQIEIATAVAGVRQKEAFLVLMDNMDKALTYQTAQTDAAGLAQERYGIYLESVEAKQAKLNATMQELYSKTINSESIKALLDLATAIAQFTSDIGGILPVLTTFIGLYLAFNKALLVEKITNISKSFLNLKDSFILASTWMGKLTGQQALQTAQTTANTTANAANVASQTAVNTSKIASTTATTANTTANVANVASQTAVNTSKIASTTATTANTTAQIANNTAVGQAAAVGEANFEIELAEVQATLSHERALIADTAAQEANNIAKSGAASSGIAAASGIGAMGSAAGGATGAIAGLASVLSIVGIVITVVMGIVMVWNKIQSDHKKKIEESTEAIEKYGDRLADIPSKTKTVTDLFGEIQKLEIKKKSGPLSPEEAENLISYYSQLRDILPDLPWHYLNGQPFLDMTSVTLGTIIDKVNELKYATDEEKQAFDTFMKDKQEKYQEDVIRYNKEIERRKYLEEINNLYFAAEKENLESGAQAVMEYMASFNNPDIWNSLTESQQSAIDELRENFSNLPEGMDETSWKTQWKQLFDDTVTSIGKDSETIATAQDQFYALFSAGWDASAGELKPWLRDFLGDAVDTAFVQDIVNRVKRDVALALSGQGMLGTGDTGWAAKYEAEQTRLNQIYLDQREIINGATDAFLGLQKATEGQTLNSKESKDAAIEWIDKYNKLTGSTLRLSDVMQGGIVNLDQIRNLTENTIQSTDATNELTDANSEYADILNSDVADALAAIEDVTSRTLITVSFLADSFNLTEEQYKNLVSDVSGTLWTLVEESGASITDINYQQITSADNLKIALESQLLSFGDFIAQLVAQGIAGIDDILAYLDSAAAHAAGVNPYSAMLPKGTGGGGGGGGGKTPEQIAAQKEIDAIEDKIKALQDQKKALQDQLKDYKDYIDAQKESLKRAKEEADFQDELANKHKNLAKIKAQIAMLALDNSEEAQRKRLELEEEAGNQEKEITSDVEDRKYDLQVQALDDLQERFEEAIDAQIDAIDKVIDKLNDQKDSLRDIASGSGGGGGGSYRGVTEAAMTFEEKVQWVMDRVKERNNQLITDLGISEQKMKDMVQDWINMGIKIDDAALRLENYLNLLANTPPQWGGWSGPEDEMADTGNPGQGQIRHHGGMVESHHGGEFAGNLMSNEVFAKLLKGEYVATEGQMNNFLKNILPKIISKSPPELKYSSGGAQGSMGDVNFDVNIIVQGSLDKSVLPELEKSLLKSVNKALARRGILRTANSFSM